MNCKIELTHKSWEGLAQGFSPGHLPSALTCLHSSQVPRKSNPIDWDWVPYPVLITSSPHRRGLGHLIGRSTRESCEMGEGTSSTQNGEYCQREGNCVHIQEPRMPPRSSQEQSMYLRSLVLGMCSINYSCCGDHCCQQAKMTCFRMRARTRIIFFFFWVQCILFIPHVTKIQISRVPSQTDGTRISVGEGSLASSCLTSRWAVSFAH